MRYSHVADPASAAPSVSLSHAYLERLSAACERRQFTGTQASEKLRAAVGWTTLSQRDAMTVFELNHKVVSYRAWPTEVTLRWKGEGFTYWPSLGFDLVDGRQAIVDVVRREDEATPERAAFDDLLRRALAELGMGLSVVGERLLRNDRSLPNARAITREAGWPVDAAAQFSCVRRFAAFGRPMSLGSLGQESRELRATACVLAMRRVLAIDLRAPSVDHCAIRLGMEGAA